MMGVAEEATLSMIVVRISLVLGVSPVLLETISFPLKAHKAEARH